MGFLAPLMLLGCVAVAIPVTLHLLGRSRAPVVDFPAVRFLLASPDDRRRHIRWRELLLLLSRLAICLAIAWLLSQPYCLRTSHGIVAEDGPQAAVIVIDNSLASGYRVDGQPVLASAKTQALDVIEQLGGDADIAVLTTVVVPGADTGTRKVGRDHKRLARGIDGLSVQPVAGDTAGALRRALGLLSASRHDRRTIFLFTAASRPLSQDDIRWPQDQVGLAVVQLLPQTGRRNLAVVDIDVQHLEADGRIEVRARVANTGDVPIKEHPVSVRVGTKVLARGELSVAPGQSASKTFVVELPKKSRSRELVFVVDPDALPLDDQRFARAAAPKNVRVLLVNGDAHTDRFLDELFYLKTAFGSRLRVQSGIQPTVVTAEEFLADYIDGAALGAQDVVVLANVRALRSQMVTVLQRWVRNGGGLVISSGAHVDASAYNKTMSELLPRKLRSTYRISEGREPLRLLRYERSHGIFAMFDKNDVGLMAASFRGVVLVEPDSGKDRPIATLSNGAALVVERRLGAGRVLLFTSTLDRDWSDFVIHAGYLPFVQQVVHYLGQTRDDDSVRDGLVGERIRLSVPEKTDKIEVHGPNGTVVFDSRQLTGTESIFFDDTQTPGMYRVVTSRTDNGNIRKDTHKFAVNLSEDASNLMPLSEEFATIATADDASPAVAATASFERQVNLWPSLGLALLVLLCLESLLGRSRP